MDDYDINELLDSISAYMDESTRKIHKLYAHGDMQMLFEDCLEGEKQYNGEGLRNSLDEIIRDEDKLDPSIRRAAVKIRNGLSKYINNTYRVEVIYGMVQTYPYGDMHIGSFNAPFGIPPATNMHWGYDTARANTTVLAEMEYGPDEYDREATQRAYEEALAQMENDTAQVNLDEAYSHTMDAIRQAQDQIILDTLADVTEEPDE
jgi:hypothetical protein